MTDRFDVQLRQHLLSTADERPAEGQLAAVVGGVARTSQRQPLVARLTWNPGRVGPFPSAAIRYALVAAALVGALLTAALLGAGILAPKTVFEGTWTSIDPGDGSTQFLTVGAGANPVVEFVDEHASGAACRNDTVKRFVARGHGVITGNRLDPTFPIGGGCGTVTVDIAARYDYDPGTGTLIDQDQVVWSRVQGGDRPVTTIRPTTAPTQLARDPDCIDLSKGGPYGARVGSLFVTVTGQSRPDLAWEGRRGNFDLAGSCQTGSPIDIQMNVVTSVYADACDATSAVAVTSTADAVRQFAAQRGDVVGQPGDQVLNRYAAKVFEIDYESADCDEPILWNDIGLTDGRTYAYFVDVKGVTLGIALRFRTGPAPTEGMQDEARMLLDSLYIVDGLAPEATDPPAVGTCIPFDTEGTYTADADAFRVSVTVPGPAGRPWAAVRDSFSLQPGVCDGIDVSGSFPAIGAFDADDVFVDTCHWRDGTLPATTLAETVAALTAQTGHDTVGPIDARLGSYPAKRFDLSIAPSVDVDACEFHYEQVRVGRALTPGMVTRIYVAEIDGRMLWVTAEYPADLPQAEADQIDTILATLRLAG